MWTPVAASYGCDPGRDERRDEGAACSLSARLRLSRSSSRRPSSRPRARPPQRTRPGLPSSSDCSPPDSIVGCFAGSFAAVASRAWAKVRWRAGDRVVNARPGESDSGLGSAQNERARGHAWSSVRAGPRPLRDRLGDRILAGAHRRRCVRGGGRRRPARLRAHQAGAAGDLEVRLRLHLVQAWDPVKEHFGALDFIYGTVYTSFFAVLLAAPLAIAIALFLTELAPRGVRGVDRHARRAARRDPECRHRPLGNLRPRAVRRGPTRAVPAAAGSGGCPFFKGTPSADGLPHGGDRARDHDPADHREHRARAVPHRSARPQGGCARARHDALGDDPRRRPAVHEAAVSSRRSSSGSAARSARRSPSRR